MVVRKKKKRGDSKRRTPTEKRTGSLRPPWKKGQSGNPSGRPRADAALRDAAREYTQEALDVLAGCLKSKSAAIKIKAARELLDRGWGKPRQSVELGATDDVSVRVQVITIGGKKIEF